MTTIVKLLLVIAIVLCIGAMAFNSIKPTTPAQTNATITELVSNDGGKTWFTNKVEPVTNIIIHN